MHLSTSQLLPRHAVAEGDLKTRLEVEVCCAFGRPSHYRLRCEKDAHVKVTAIVTGGNHHCRKTRELFDNYVIEDCGAIWKKIYNSNAGMVSLLSPLREGVNDGVRRWKDPWAGIIIGYIFDDAISDPNANRINRFPPVLAEMQHE